MIGDAAAAGAHHLFQVLVVLDHQIAGGAAGEYLDAADAAAELEFGQFGNIRLRAADIQAHVAPGDLLRIALLPGQLFRIDDGREGVRHIEHRRQPAQDGAPRSRGDGLHRGVAGIAQMHMRVDQAGQHVQAGGVDGFIGRGIGGCADGGDAAVANADIGGFHAPGQDTDAVADQQIEMAGHRRIPFMRSRARPWRVRAAPGLSYFAASVSNTSPAGASPWMWVRCHSA